MVPEALRTGLVMLSTTVRWAAPPPPSLDGAGGTEAPPLPPHLMVPEALRTGLVMLSTTVRLLAVR